MIASTPTAYAYGRVSHRDQIDKNESVPNQIQRSETFYKTHLEPKGVLWGGVEYDKKNVSAYMKPFFKREAGMRLLAKLRKGDYLIVDKMDRLCRRVIDFTQVDQVLTSVGVKLCFVDFFGSSVERGTPMGDLFLHIAVSFAQFESANTSMRIKLSRKMRRDGHLWDYSRPIMGTKVVGKGNNRTLVWDHDYRKIMAEIVDMYHSHQISFEQISIILETRHLTAQNKPIPNLKSAFVVRQHWSEQRVRRTYQRELLYRRLSDLTPAELQHYFLQKSNRYNTSNKPSAWSKHAIRGTRPLDQPAIDGSVTEPGS